MADTERENLEQLIHHYNWKETEFIKKCVYMLNNDVPYFGEVNAHN